MITKLFSSCFPVKGETRSVICDVQRAKVFYIPNILHHILTTYRNSSIDEVKSNFETAHWEQIDEYFDYLLENELVFETSEPENFPEVEVNWDSYHIINNAIIDTNAASNHNYEKILFELEELRCDFVEFRFFDKINIEQLYQIAKITTKSRFRNITFMCKFNSDFLEQDISNLLLAYQRIGTIVFYDTPVDITENYDNFNQRLIYISDQLNSEKCCGIVDESLFNINMSLYMESHFFNSCLNKKISVDTQGRIKNCPSMARSFGKTNEITLSEALEKEGFKNLWEINKDKIEGCNVCEFRYICTDCRAYLSDPENILGKPLKCGYDPYTGKWEKWYEGKHKQKAIEYYGMKDSMKR